MALSRRLQADLWIVLLSAVWGCTFVVVKRALDDISPLLLVTTRFAIAAVPMYFLVPRGALRMGRGSAASPVTAGLVTGGLLLVGFAFQTTGLQYTTPARSAFITGMYVIFTPLMAIALRRRPPSVASFVGAATALVGLYLLTDPGSASSGAGRGEALTLLCAVAFSGHLLAVDHYTRLFDKRAVAFLQVAVVALMGAPLTLTLEPLRLSPTPQLLAALAVTSLIGTAFAFFVLNAVQAWTTPTRAAIIFAAEPVFAALTSWVVEGEVLEGLALLGAALILTGILIAEVGPSRQVPGEARP